MNSRAEYEKLYRPMPHPSPIAEYWMAEINKMKEGILGMKKTFLICPVRGHSSDETHPVVKKLESEGWTVHWPPRDTDQDDPTGFEICTTNCRAIFESEIVHVVWDVDSKGSHFDLGIAFALKKPIRIIELKQDDPPGKSFVKVMEQMK